MKPSQVPDFLTLGTQGCKHLCFSPEILVIMVLPSIGIAYLWRVEKESCWITVRLQLSQQTLCCVFGRKLCIGLRFLGCTFLNSEYHLMTKKLLFCCTRRRRNCRKLNTKCILKARDSYKTSQSCSLAYLSIFYWTEWIVPLTGEILCSIVFLLQKKKN